MNKKQGVPSGAGGLAHVIPAPRQVYPELVEGLGRTSSGNPSEKNGTRLFAMIVPE